MLSFKFNIYKMPITLNDSSPLSSSQLFGVGRFLPKLPLDPISHIILAYTGHHSFILIASNHLVFGLPLHHFLPTFIFITILTDKEYKFKLKNKIRKLNLNFIIDSVNTIFKEKIIIG